MHSSLQRRVHDAEHPGDRVQDVGNLVLALGELSRLQLAWRLFAPKQRGMPSCQAADCARMPVQWTGNHGHGAGQKHGCTKAKIGQSGVEDVHRNMEGCCHRRVLLMLLAIPEILLSDNRSRTHKTRHLAAPALRLPFELAAKLWR